MIERINRSLNKEHGLYIWFLGQAGFVLQSGNHRVVIDPYLTGMLEHEAGAGRAKLSSRAYAPPVAASDLTGVDLICITHDHGDHLDAGTLAPLREANPSAVVAAPAFCRDKLRSVGFSQEQILRTPTLEWSAIGEGLRIYPVPAAHYDLEKAAGDHKFLGFVLDIDGTKIYHSGDTIVHPELLHTLKGLVPIDVAMVTINGRHAFREAQNFIGNMTYQEAADLVGTLGVKLAIPMHHDLMRFNSEHPANFVRHLVDHWPDTPYRVLQAGRGHFYFPES